MQATIPTVISCEATHLQSNAQNLQLFEQMWPNTLRSFKDEVRNPCTFTRLHISIWVIFGLIDDTMRTVGSFSDGHYATALWNSPTIERPMHMWEWRIDLLTFSIWMKAKFMSSKFIWIGGRSRIPFGYLGCKNWTDSHLQLGGTKRCLCHNSKTGPLAKQLRIWWRYVDDVFAIIKANDVERVLNISNSHFLSVNFNYGEENRTVNCFSKTWLYTE